jgi:TRAP-type mannitol/chloroaromatic compound transport system substrate-binding protein
MKHDTIKRRRFLKTAGLGAAGTVAAGVAAPAIAQSMPEVKWRLTSSFPKSLDTLYGGAELFAKAMHDMSDGKFQVRVFASGEIVPGLQVLDAVQNGTVEAGQTASYYYYGKHPAFVFGTGLPFSFNQRQQHAWLYNGGGIELMNEFWSDFNVIGYTFGGTGAQMGGWYRKEINTVDDLKGLKFRIGGFAGLIVERLGVVPQQLAGGDIYPALEKGTLDACEWVGPYDDEKLGFQKVAKYYYYPGWWEGCATGTIYFNKQSWAQLPKAYQAMAEVGTHLVNNWMLPKYDAGNPGALRRLVAQGTELRAFPRPVMEACFETAYAFYDELCAKDAKFKKIFDSLKAFRTDQNLWFRVAENSFDAFQYAMSAKGK